MLFLEVMIVADTYRCRLVYVACYSNMHVGVCTILNIRLVGRLSFDLAVTWFRWQNGGSSRFMVTLYYTTVCIRI